jgi:hypothetical protein
MIIDQRSVGLFPFWDYFKENEEEVYKECPAIKNL